tara:strand:+ start:364 stop:654 length:291 start_codon:yes stop_codon:yes gene_type:complete
MKFIFLFLLVFIFTKANSYNLFEKIAFGAGVIILYDQYFDNSLSSKQIYDKKKDVMNKSLVQRKRNIFNYNPTSQAEMIMILDVTEELNIQKKYFK